MGLASFFHTASHPKQALSKAIASALGEYFEIDADQIEANLLADTHIRLKCLTLKKQCIRLPSNAVAIITGTVSHVEFAWKWSSLTKSNDPTQHQHLPKDAWVQDSTLRIQGPKFRVELSTNGDLHPSTTGEGGPSTNVEAAPSTKEQQNGLQGYIRRQVQIIIDSLTLDLVDFEWEVVLPITETTMQSKTIRIGGQQVQLKSLGRHSIEELLEGESNVPVKDATTANPTSDALKQSLRISSFFASIAVSEHDDTSKKLDLMEPFSYEIQMTRTGDRFGGYATGVNCQGRPLEENPEFVLHAEEAQIAALTQLGALLVAPPSEQSPVEQQEHVKHEAHISVDPAENCDPPDANSSNAEVSLFHFPLSSVKLILLDGSTISGVGAHLTYKADGSQMDASIEKLRYLGLEDANDDTNKENSHAVQATMSQICVSAHPHQVITIESIDTVHVPGVLSLNKPLHKTTITYEGNALDIRLQTVHASMLVSPPKSSTASDKDATTKQGFGSLIPIPFPVRLAVDGSSVVDSVHGAPFCFDNFCVFLNPDVQSHSTHVAIELDEFKNDLLLLKGAKVFAALPLDQPDEIQSLKVSTDSVKVTAGKSKQEWQEKFTPKEDLQPTNQSVICLPRATVSSTKLTVSWKGTGVSLKDTAITTSPYQGDDNTTSEDIMRFFTHTCLKRVPGFISNTEVFGVNVVEFTTSLGLSGLAGSGAGLAAVVAVDSVKGAFQAGKKQRGGDDGTGFRPDDLFRGILHASAGAANSAAKKRGKEKGNVLDFASGVTSATGEYVDKNKSRLGSAGAGGAGVIVGTVFGGPLGGLAAGLVASKLTKSTIDHVEGKSRVVEK